jgi:hypothetical protein
VPEHGRVEREFTRDAPDQRFLAADATNLGADVGEGADGDVDGELRRAEGTGQHGEGDELGGGGEQEAQARGRVGQAHRQSALDQTNHNQLQPLTLASPATGYLAQPGGKCGSQRRLRLIPDQNGKGGHCLNGLS